MKWGIFDAGTKSTGERGSGRIYKNSGRIYKKCIRGRFALAGMKNFLYICLVFFQPKTEDSVQNEKQVAI
jgi:hypothetical protein